MASLLNADPALREYILKHSLPQTFQALLTGLCISCPDSPLHYLESKIMFLQEHQDIEINWHTFIDEAEKVAMTSLAGSLVVHEVFESVDDTLRVSHLFAKAYSCYRKSSMNMCFKAWKGFMLNQKQEAVELRSQMELAEQHRAQRSQRLALTRWLDWLQLRRQRQNEARMKIQRVWNAVHCKAVIAAWRFIVHDSKRTKEYFERLEKDLVELGSQDSEAPMGEGRDGLSTLPCKLSLQIFQCLGVADLLRCAQVCRTWKAIAQTCSLWSQINFSMERSWVSDSTVQQILQKYRPYVTRLNMRACSSLRRPSFRCISECRNLQELNLSECSNVNDEVVMMIVEGCPTLLYLNLSATPVTDGTLRELARCCVNLQYLSLACCRGFSDRGLQYLSAGPGCHRLVHLNLSSCTQISVGGFRYVAAGCPRLKQLVLNDMPTLSDGCVLALVAKCRSLSAIDLLDTPYLSDSAFKAIAEVANLSTFNTEGNSRVTDISWKALSRGSPGLTKLGAAGCPRMTDAGLRPLAALRHLHSLNIAHCCRVSDVGMKYLTEGPSASKLLELNLSHCRITDLSIMRLAQRCPRLTRLSVCYCENLTDSSLEWLNGSSLLCLDLTGCSILDQGLASLGGNCGLKKLVVSECVRITDIGVEKFCRQVRGLDHMDVSHCVSLSDHAVKALSFYCRNITTLKMPGCPKMTDMAVQYLAGAARYLRVLDVSGCVLLSDRTPRLLTRGCPHLHTLTMQYCCGITRQAALRLQPGLQHWEHSNDDAPCWFGYDNRGQLLQPIRTPRKKDDSWGEESATALSNSCSNENKSRN